MSKIAGNTEHHQCLGAILRHDGDTAGFSMVVMCIPNSLLALTRSTRQLCLQPCSSLLCPACGVNRAIVPLPGFFILGIEDKTLRIASEIFGLSVRVALSITSARGQDNIRRFW